MSKLDYKSAGVDIDAGNEAVDRIKKGVRSTFTTNVLTGLGSFGSLYDLKPILEKYQDPVMVQSIDGVGTKTIIARKLGKFDTIGIDLLSAAANDILVMGARPLTFLDYIANDKLDPAVVEEIVSGMVKACKDTGVSLVGGETAEMPDTYLPGEHDLVGVITGVVEKDKILTGKKIKAGHAVLGLPSNGLHTNGYSFARKLFFEIGGYSVNDTIPELKKLLYAPLLKTKVLLYETYSLSDASIAPYPSPVARNIRLFLIIKLLPSRATMAAHIQQYPIDTLFNEFSIIILSESIDTIYPVGSENPT